MNIVNCTPHPIDVELVNGEMRTIPPSGILVRTQAVRTLARVIDDVPFYTTTYENVTGLPDPEPDTIYVVSGLTLTALAGSRPDVVAPADLLRDNTGAVIGCRGFTF